MIENGGNFVHVRSASTRPIDVHTIIKAQAQATRVR